MTVLFRQVAITAAGVIAAGATIATPANARPTMQADNSCGPSSSAPTLCVSAVHNGHDVKSITVRNLTGAPGRIRVRWDDFHRSTSDANHTWHVDDEQGRTRDGTHALRHSDLICATLEQQSTGAGGLLSTASIGSANSTPVCVTI